MRTFTIILGAILIILLGSCNQKSGDGRKYDSWLKDETTGKWGFISYNGDTTIPFMYDSVKYIKNRTFSAILLNEKWGIVEDGSGKVIIPNKYDLIADLDGRKIAKVNIGGEDINKNFTGGKWGLVSVTEGKEIVPCMYEKLYYGLRDTVITVEVDSKIGKINFNGEVVEPLVKLTTSYYSGKMVKGNETRMVSFTLQTKGTERSIYNFSFEVEKDLGAGQGALGRKKNFSVKTGQVLKLSADGIYTSEQIEVSIKPNQAICSIINEGQKYTCNALPNKK